MDRIYQEGMATLSGGNLSMRDENGDVWIAPSGVDKSKLTGGDMNRVQTDGTCLGPHPPSSELPFHRAIYEQSPDVRAIVHAHPPALVAFSIVREVPDTRIIPQANPVCGRAGYAQHAAISSVMTAQSPNATAYAMTPLPFDSRTMPESCVLPHSIPLIPFKVFCTEPQKVSDMFALRMPVAIVENDCVLTVGNTVLEAFDRWQVAEFSAKSVIDSTAIGDRVPINDADIDELMEAFSLS